MPDEGARELLGGLEGGEVAFEVVVVVNAAEGLVDDARTFVGVFGLDRAELDTPVPRPPWFVRSWSALPPPPFVGLA